LRDNTPPNNSHNNGSLDPQTSEKGTTPTNKPIEHKKIKLIGRSKLRLIISLSLTLVFALAIFFFVINHFEEFQEIWRRPLPHSVLAAMIPSYLLLLSINSELLRYPLRAYGVKLSFTEGLALTAATTAINYVIPLKSGSGLRGLYLAGCHKMTVTNFMAFLVGISTMTLTIASLFALVGLIILAADGHGTNAVLFVYFGSALVIGLGAIFFLGRLPFKLPRRLASFAESWDSLRTTPGMFNTITLFSVGYFLSWALLTWLSLALFGIHLSIAGIFFYTAGQIHTTLINLTPAGLGLVEAFGVFAGTVLGFTPTEALSAQAVNRLTAVAVLAVMGLWGWFYLTNNLKRLNV
jgi:uncharacterized membrane protein YbhN (UPF0104 family)